jgi:serine phosphatase RsbU (regulator of sigma subunit)
MFPKNNEENILLAKNVPSLDVSGDFYNFKNLEDKIFFTLGDVSGKGVDAGLIMARVTSLFEILVEEKKSLIEIVSLINDNLYNLRSGKFLTGIFAVYDKKSKNLEFINAGHSESIISENKKITEHVSSKIPPLGVQPINLDLNSVLNQISLKDKIFYVYSDGLSESKDFEGNEIEAEGIIDLLNKNKDHDIATQLENIFIEISAFGALQNMSNEEQSIIKDDLTILAINGKNI